MENDGSLLSRLQAVPWEASLPRDEKQRTWWASTAMPAAANLAVVLYKAEQTPDFRVRLLLNERAVPVPACDGKFECDLDSFVVSRTPILLAGDCFTLSGMTQEIVDCLQESFEVNPDEKFQQACFLDA